MRRKLLAVSIGLLVVLGLLLMTGCGDSGDDDLADAGRPTSQGDRGPAGPAGPPSTRTATVTPYPTPTATPTAAPAPAPYYSDAGGGVKAEQPLSAERMIVRTGEMNLKVRNVAEALDLVKSIADREGGYVLVSNRFGGDRSGSANISIRVPADRYDAAVNSLRSLALEVLRESTSAKDVTDEYTDLSAHLRNLEATERQYLALLEKADKIPDMLSIEANLSNTRGRIEQTRGRMLLLERTSAMSLINIDLVEDAPLKVDFTVNTIETQEGGAVYFTNRATGGSPPYGYRWDFGDGKTSTEPNPTIRYREPGKYTVSLTVTDSKGDVVQKTMDARITIVAESGWSGGDTADSAWNGLVDIGHGLASFFIWVGILAPVWIPVGLIGYGAVRRINRKRAS